MPVRKNIDKNWDKKQLERADKGLFEMVTDVHKRAGIIAPKETRALLNSGVIERIQALYYKVRFGNARVRYARRRHFENKKNPQSKRYLEKAGESVARGSKEKYFK